MIMEEKINITAAILAGGLGTRLRPIVKDRPKVLSKVMGRSFLTYILDQLVAAGLQDVILCTGYKSEMVKETFGNQYKTLNLIYSEEDKPLGTFGALRNALPHINSGYILVMNGDSYVNFQITSYLDWFFNSERQAAIALTHVQNVSRYGKIEISNEQSLKKFSEKSMNQGPGWINAGIYILKTSLMESVITAAPCSIEHDFFPRMIDKGLYGFPVKGEFIDIGTPESYHDAEHFFYKIFTSSDKGGDCK